MNLLEHYIEKIYSKEDVTDEFEKKIGHKPHERLYLLDIDVNCYGRKERIKKRFFESELNFAEKNGYYMA